MNPKKVSGRATVKVDFSIQLTLTKGEAKALDAIVGYGVEPFLKVFYENLGKSYLQPYESDMTNLFSRIKEQLLPEISKIEKAENNIAGILKQF